MAVFLGEISCNMSDDSDYELPILEDVVQDLDQFPAEIKTTTKITSKKKQVKKPPKPISEEKLTKIRERNRAKAMQPKEAMKNIQILLDQRLRNVDKKEQILNSIKEKCDVNVVNDELLVLENCVCWKRKDFDDETSFIWEPDVCVIINSKELLKIIEEEDNANDSLFLYVNKLKSQLPTGAKLRLVLIGITNLNSKLKNNNKTNLINLRQIIFEVSLRCGVNFHQEPDFISLGYHLVDCTKSIAEKLCKKRKETFKDCLAFAPDQKCIKLDDSKETKKLCWRRMLHSIFSSKPNAEGAAKIISETYCSLRSLLDAYQTKTSVKERELMLENLIADNITKFRVGPSISTAVYRTLMFSDSEVAVDKPKT